VKLDREAIANAAQRLNGHIVSTPVQSLNGEALGVPYRLTLKLENLQHSGSFKARGALNALLCAEVGSDGVIAASGGNHGAAVAWAARSLQYPANIFVPSVISSRKLEKLKSYGARQFTLDRNCVELHAYDQAEVVSGAGTIAMEIDAQVPDATTVIVACGGGGLAGGLATWWGTSKRLIAVETEGTQSWAKARAAGEPVDIEVSGLAADSLGARRIGDLGWNALVSSRAESVVVSDQETAAAQGVLATEFGVPSEPAAAAGLAGLLSGKIAISPHEHGVLVICGANSD
jgi:threonine dehydratase